MNSIDSIVEKMYAVISGRTTDERDWDALRTLYAPGARLIPIEKNPDGSSIARVMTVEEFITSRSAFFRQHDFYEWETAREERRYGRLVQLWSTYEAAAEPGGAPIRKGVNSIQLWHDDKRWWILTCAWDAIEALDRAR